MDLLYFYIKQAYNNQVMSNSSSSSQPPVNFPALISRFKKGDGSLCGSIDWGHALCVEARHGSIENVKLLLDSGVDVNAKAKIDVSAKSRDIFFTALQSASIHGQLEVVKFLVRRGADVSVSKESIKNSALLLALKNNHLNVASYLFSFLKGATEADTHTLYFYLLHQAIIGVRHLEAFQFLLDRGIEPYRVAERTTPLVFASDNRVSEYVRALLDAGADVNELCGRTQNSAIYFAASDGVVDVVKEIMFRGVEIDMIRKSPAANGQHILRSVISNKNFNICKLLTVFGYFDIRTIERLFKKPASVYAPFLNDFYYLVCFLNMHDYDDSEEVFSQLTFVGNREKLNDCYESYSGWKDDVYAELISIFDAFSVAIFPRSRNEFNKVNGTLEASIAFDYEQGLPDFDDYGSSNEDERCKRRKILRRFVTIGLYCKSEEIVDASFILFPIMLLLKEFPEYLSNILLGLNFLKEQIHRWGRRLAGLSEGELNLLHRNSEGILLHSYFNLARSARSCLNYLDLSYAKIELLPDLKRLLGVAGAREKSEMPKFSYSNPMSRYRGGRVEVRNACKKGHLVHLSLLISRYGLAHKHGGRSILVWAVQFSPPKAFAELVSQAKRGGGALCEGVDWGRVLCVAVSEGLLENLQLLIESGVDVNAKSDHTGLTALDTALIKGHLEVVRLLVDSGANISVSQESISNSALFRALKSNHFEVASYLFSFLKGDTDADTRALYFCLLRQAIREECQLEMFQFLLDRGIEPYRIANTTTPLVLAAATNLSRHVRGLLDAGANVNELCGKTKKSAIFLAVTNGFIGVVKEFLFNSDKFEIRHTSLVGDGLHVLRRGIKNKHFNICKLLAVFGYFDKYASLHLFRKSVDEYGPFLFNFYYYASYLNLHEFVEDDKLYTRVGVRKQLDIEYSKHFGCNPFHCRFFTSLFVGFSEAIFPRDTQWNKVGICLESVLAFDRDQGLKDFQENERSKRRKILRRFVTIGLYCKSEKVIDSSFILFPVAFLLKEFPEFRENILLGIQHLLGLVDEYGHELKHITPDELELLKRSDEGKLLHEYIYAPSLKRLCLNQLDLTDEDIQSKPYVVDAIGVVYPLKTDFDAGGVEEFKMDPGR